MKKEEVLKNKFLKVPGYLRNSNKFLAKRWKVSIEEVKQAREAARAEIGSSVTPKWAQEENYTSDVKKSWDERREDAILVFNTDEPITNLEEALIKAGVDLTVWEVDRHVANTWSVTMKDTEDKSATGKPVRANNYQYKVWFKKKSTEVSDFVTEVTNEISKHKLEDFVVVKKDFEDQDYNKCGIINLFDAHIDKMCYIGNGNLETNIYHFEKSFDSLLAGVIQRGASTIIIPIGNDFWNTNVGSSTTKKGTPQQNVAITDVDGFSIGIKVIRRCIEKAAQYCDVKVIIIPGNHDEDKCLYAGELLKQVYELSSQITIDNSTVSRKYVRWGKCLFGFAHGDKEKSKINQLPLIMAEEAKQDWGETTFREFYLGDIHHKEEFKFLRGKDFIGCMVRFLRSVGLSEDKWHLEQGYIGVPKTAESFVWDKRYGLISNDLKNIVEW